VLTVKNKSARIKLAIGLVVDPAEIDTVLQNTERHDGKREDVRPRLQVTPERFVGPSKGYMSVNAAIDHVAIPLTVSAAPVGFFT
jgi:hypothetical protein